MKDNFKIKKMRGIWFYWVPVHYGERGWHRTGSWRAAMSDVLARAGHP